MSNSPFGLLSYLPVFVLIFPINEYMSRIAIVYQYKPKPNEQRTNRKEMAPYPYKLKTTAPDIQYETFDGAKFGYMSWPAQNGTDAVKGRVLLIHGFGEYTKIQFRLMDNLSLNGYESFTFDQRGAGVTSPGKLKGVTDEHHVFNDLEHFVEKNLSECNAKGIPLFMWGHSMGGGICLNYACQGKHKNEISGYIGSGPLIILHPHTMYNKPTQIIAPLLAKFLPRVRIDTGLDLKGITSDKAYRDFLGSDPMSVPLYGSFRQIHDFMQRGAKLYKNENNYIQKNFAKNKPVIIMHGQDDTINDPKGSEKFIQDCPSDDKKLKLYPGARHSIFSLETDEVFNTVFSDMKQWLDQHTAVKDSP